MKKLLCVAMLLCLAGCATYRPIIDMKNVDLYQYDQDLAECQEYAKKVSPETSAVIGAGAGAAIGAVVGLVVGAVFNVNPGKLAGAGAAMGGMQGAVAGGAGAAKSQMDIIRNCMAGRGYKVLK